MTDTPLPVSSEAAEEECNVRCEIPEAIRDDLVRIGGISGLKNRLPSPERIGGISATHHALSDPVRIMILHLLSVQPLCVCVIRECIGISGSKLSYHLNIMKENGLIVSEQQGNWIIYRITEKGRIFAENPAE
ncbi:hypothetical protein SDC9_35342 [bioreactor metagenome]|uniref:HTH arsR-type domain-containing protein n=1 Tax=bioreactor metagenome TaxID=1076179 RepID=A0A644VDA5_9ZZZZ|nr:metalloregulator ArsR/SmtB family transcription factor [Methanocorpusculum sp.]